MFIYRADIRSNVLDFLHGARFVVYSLQCKVSVMKCAHDDRITYFQIQ